MVAWRKPQELAALGIDSYPKLLLYSVLTLKNQLNLQTAFPNIISVGFVLNSPNSKVKIECSLPVFYPDLIANNFDLIAATFDFLGSNTFQSDGVAATPGSAGSYAFNQSDFPFTEQSYAKAAIFAAQNITAYSESQQKISPQADLFNAAIIRVSESDTITGTQYTRIRIDSLLPVDWEKYCCTNDLIGSLTDPIVRSDC